MSGHYKDITGKQDIFVEYRAPAEHFLFCFIFCSFFLFFWKGTGAKIPGIYFFIIKQQQEQTQDFFV